MAQVCDLKKNRLAIPTIRSFVTIRVRTFVSAAPNDDPHCPLENEPLPFREVGHRVAAVK